MTSAASSSVLAGLVEAKRTMVNEREQAMNHLNMASRTSPATDEQARATPTITNRSVKVVDEPALSSKPPQTNFMSKKRAFLMHALSQIETEISKMHHAQKTAQELELNLRNRRVALVEQEMEMHEKRCDYLEVLRRFSAGTESPPNVRDGDSTSALMEEMKAGMKRPNLEDCESSPSKKLRMQDPSFGRGFLPPSLPPRWMPHMPTPTMGGSVPALEQSSLTLLSEMAMCLLGTIGGNPQSAMPTRRPSIPIRRPSMAQSSMPVRRPSLSPPSMPTMRRPSMAEQGSALIAYQRLTRSPNNTCN